MAESSKNNALAGLTTVQSLKAMTQPGTSYARRFDEVMGKKAPKFIASLVSVTQQSSLMQKCDPMEIMQAAMVAATLDLDIVPTLGFAAIVPYNDTKTGTCHPQFQVMTKGLVQLGIRSNQYRTINAGLVYKDEIKGYDVITGNVRMDVPNGGQRSKDSFGNTLKDLDEAGVAGAFAYFETTSGYEKMVYWPLEQIINHGKRYSQSFRSDIRYNKQSSLWTTNLRAMAVKTVLKNLLSKWGPLSTSMEMAITEDQKVYTNNGSGYLDNESDAEELPDASSDRKEASKKKSQGAKALEAMFTEEADKPAETDEKVDGNGMIEGSLDLGNDGSEEKHEYNFDGIPF